VFLGVAQNREDAEFIMRETTRLLQLFVNMMVDPDSVPITGDSPPPPPDTL